MSDFILSLSHYHRHISIYVVQIIDMMLLDLALGRMSFTGFAFYIAVCCGFDKHLYQTSCLNGCVLREN